MDHRHCLAPGREQPHSGARIGSASYARMFPELPAFKSDDAFLVALGRAGGLCDCADEEDEPASLGSEAAGWPFFGQFVAHDITADRSAIGVVTGPFRATRFLRIDSSSSAGSDWLERLNAVTPASWRSH